MRQQLMFIVVIGIFIGLGLLAIASILDKPSPFKLSGGILCLLPKGKSISFLSDAVKKISPGSFLLPTRFVGIYQTKASKPYQSRYLTVLVNDIATVKEILKFNYPTPIVILGDGIPKNFSVKELEQWENDIKFPAKATLIHLSRQERALKWTVMLIMDSRLQVGKDACFILIQHASETSVRNLVKAINQPIQVSLRSTLRPIKAFWTAWFGLLALLFSGHLLLSLFWNRWRNLSCVSVLLRESWLYQFISVVYFSLYLTAIGVIYNRPDFQDAVTMPMRYIAPLSLWKPLLISPLLWLWNWFVQVIVVMLPSALIPPAGIVVGHLRGMVEQALTTAPIAHGGGYISSIFTALTVFWQGEATIVAMVWSGMLTRAIIAPHTFGTDDYWTAYKSAWKDFIPLAKLVGFLTLVTTLIWICVTSFWAINS